MGDMGPGAGGVSTCVAASAKVVKCVPLPRELQKTERWLPHGLAVVAGVTCVLCGHMCGVCAKRPVLEPQGAGQGGEGRS